MKQIVLDFSRVGWKAAIVKFFTDLAHTLVAVAFVFVLHQLNATTIDPSTNQSETLILALGLIRAAWRAFGVWLTTRGFIVDTPVAS